MQPAGPRGSPHPGVWGVSAAAAEPLSLEAACALWARPVSARWGLLEDRAGSRSVGRPLFLTQCVANWGDRLLYGIHLEGGCLHFTVF